MSALKAARLYASRGLRVLPCCWDDGAGGCGYHAECEEPGKRPITRWVRGGRGQVATIESTVIDVWFSKYPQAGLAMATGDGMFVLDVDVKPGQRGDVTLTQIEDTYGDLPPTVVTRTRSNGLHFWFSCPGVRVKNSVSSLGPGLDVRGDGGYVVVPPSPSYSFDQDLGIRKLRPAPSPDWLLDMVRYEEHDDRSPEGGAGTEALTPERIGQLCGFVKYAPAGERNTRLFWSACRIVEASEVSDDGLVKRAWQDLYTAAMYVGLDGHEARRTMDSATGAQPR